MASFTMAFRLTTGRGSEKHFNGYISDVWLSRKYIKMIKNDKCVWFRRTNTFYNHWSVLIPNTASQTFEVNYLKRHIVSRYDR